MPLRRIQIRRFGAENDWTSPLFTQPRKLLYGTPYSSTTVAHSWR
jgi:hypothetical protein